MAAASPLDLASVKEQLRLLGHAVPDDVVAGFIQGLRTGKEAPLVPGGCLPLTPRWRAAPRWPWTGRAAAAQHAATRHLLLQPV